MNIVPPCRVPLKRISEKEKMEIIKLDRSLNHLINHPANRILLWMEDVMHLPSGAKHGRIYMYIDFPTISARKQFFKDYDDGTLPN